MNVALYMTEAPVKVLGYCYKYPIYCGEEIYHGACVYAKFKKSEGDDLKEMTETAISGWPD